MMERGKIAKVFSKGRLSLAEPPLLENNPLDYFLIHLLQSARCVSGTLSPYPCDPFEKGSIENFYFLDKN